MVTSLNNAEQLVVKVEAAAPDVNNLSTALNADGIDLCNNMQMTSCQFVLLLLLHQCKQQSQMHNMLLVLIINYSTLHSSLVLPSVM